MSEKENLYNNIHCPMKGESNKWKLSKTKQKKTDLNATKGLKEKKTKAQRQRLLPQDLYALFCYCHETVQVKNCFLRPQHRL